MDPSEQLGGAVNDLRGWVEARLKGARRAIERRLLGRFPFGPIRQAGGPYRGSTADAPFAPVVLVAASELGDEITLRLIHRAGGRDSKLRIMAGFELDFAAAARRHTRQFARFGATDIVTAAVTTRVQAEDEVRAATFREADLLVLAVDDARHAALMLAGSAVGDAIRGAAARGAVVALIGDAVGLAGSWVAVAEAAGDRVAPVPAGRRVPLARPASEPPPGLELLPGWICDSSQAGTGRISGLLQALCRAPAGPERAVWLEPGGAAFFDSTGMDVWGDGAAWCVDVAEVRAEFRSLSAVRPGGALAGLPVTLVPPGYRLDPRTLTSTPVEGTHAVVQRVR